MIIPMHEDPRLFERVLNQQRLDIFQRQGLARLQLNAQLPFNQPVVEQGQLRPQTRRVIDLQTRAGDGHLHPYQGVDSVPIQAPGRGLVQALQIGLVAEVGQQ